MKNFIDLIDFREDCSFNASLGSFRTYCYNVFLHVNRVQTFKSNTINIRDPIRQRKCLLKFSK
jgi:hypothetical protein